MIFRHHTWLNHRLILNLLVSLFLAMTQSSCQQANQPQDGFLEKREAMVKYQIEGRGVRDKLVLEAMRKVPRHLFVPDELEAHAYDDGPLPIGYNQTISQPYIVAFMTEVLELNSKSKVLEIGTGSGYQAAVLAEICDSVYTIEIVEPLSTQSQKLLKTLGYNNVLVKTGDGYKGWPEYAPFDAIIVTCAPTEIPQPLQDQLAEGGLMVIPYGYAGYQRLALLRKKNGKIRKQTVLSVRFVPMVNEDGETY